ncbi:Conserved hypothetical protein; putative signal peptide [Bradyrhizobium sp. ORS 278]|uniref:hypothetical protein n=1 Tax=Bradyrhizobium sp. (strain ORS 278) TaxID=114615 RepID=UPI0001508C10|nr:hypothetical protein [Bradyrhizobium sp. ORS 278]CAL80167.1 Conserved hypothetical protein; putative signal peptide [Bradyrhizobium sp. ORS 278]
MTSILMRDSVPSAGAMMPAVVAKSPISNREAKGDRLAMVTVAAADVEPQSAPVTRSTLRQAYAYAPSEPEVAKEPAKAPVVAAEPILPKSKIMARTDAPAAPLKPEVQKAYSLLSDTQIAGIKERLRLSASQEYYWPAVETALRAVARKIHTGRQTAAKPGAVAIDPDSDEVQQLKSAAMPLLWQLRDDQKDEVRRLARTIGLDKVAAAI